MPHHSRWVQRSVAPETFLQALPADVPPLLGQLLWSRNVTDPAQIDSFLDAQYTSLHDPFALRDMDRAVARVRQALTEGQRVAVYGDFDTDGVTGVVLLTQALSALGLDVLPYIPKRLTEGYGLNTQAVEQLAQQVQLLITVDCGISNVAEIGRAQALGLDVIVLDHHTPPAVLPDGYAVINPRRADCDYPYKKLAGVGVAYKLIQALHKSGLRTGLPGRALLDMVALGTVTDMAPLDGENRILVKHGLVAMNATDRVGLRALIESATVRGPVDARTIGFALGPRINAAGRLDDAIRAYELLLETDEAHARTLADQLNTINIERQLLTKTVQQRAAELIVASGKDQQRLILLDGEEFPAGVVGLVAARLVETFGRPVLLLERGPDTSRGSGRSIAGFSIIDALTEIGDVFEKFGGHTMAAGFTLSTARLPELETRLQAIAQRDISDALLLPRLEYDAELRLSEQSLVLLALLARLEPYGHSNPEPVWVTRRVRVVEARPIGRERQHLKLKLSDGQGLAEALWWRQADQLAALQGRPWVDVAYTLSCDEYQERQRVQMIVKAIAPLA